MEEDDHHLKRKLLSPPSAADEDEKCLRDKLVEENKKLWVVAAPSIFTRFSTFGVGVISQAFIGHIGPTELAAYALVGTVLLRFANGLLLGMASALETLCGQSFGAKHYHMLGIYLQRSWIILFFTTLAILPLFIFSTPILILLGQDEDVAKMAGTISKWFIPFMFSYMWSFSLQMYLQAQSKNVIITYLAVLTLSIHLSLSWFLTVKLGLGLPGVMISMIVAMWIPVLGQLGFVFFGGCPQTWKGFSFSAFKDLGAIVKLSLSSGVMLCLELWYNTILVLLTGHMENAEIALDALSICLNINGWEMMISLGFMAAAGSCSGIRLARNNSLCKHNMLLCYRHSCGNFPGLCSWFSCKGYLDWNVNWHSCSNHSARLHHYKNRLEQAGSYRASAHKQVVYGSDKWVGQCSRTTCLKRLNFFC